MSHHRPAGDLGSAAPSPCYQNPNLTSTKEPEPPLSSSAAIKAPFVLSFPKAFQPPVNFSSLSPQKILFQVCLQTLISTLSYQWNYPQLVEPLLHSLDESPALRLALLLCLLPFKSLSQVYRQPEPFLVLQLKPHHLTRWHHNFPSPPGGPLQGTHCDLNLPSRHPHPTTSAHGYSHQVRRPALSMVRHCTAIVKEIFQLNSNPTPCLLRLKEWPVQATKSLPTKTASHPH